MNKSSDIYTASIAVVIPCYKVTAHIEQVINSIGTEVSRIYVVDDACPQESGKYVIKTVTDPRVRVLFNPVNQGVGGAVMRGYQEAIDEGFDIIVKIDGDGQMNPRLLPLFVEPILRGDADYTKGNRFFDLEEIHQMPLIRIFGNSCLSFFTKISSGYWGVFDPTNGYTAINTRVASHLPFRKISTRYFFETDILFRLNTLRAVVKDIPMDASYGDEKSNLKITKILPEFLAKHIINTGKRIFYNYYLRDMSLASIELPVGVLLSLFGIFYGAEHWMNALQTGVPATAGTVMFAALPLIIGIQLLLSFLGFDIASTPTQVLHHTLGLKKNNKLL